MIRDKLFIHNFNIFSWENTTTTVKSTMFAISLITLKIKVFVVNVLFSCERWFVKMSHFYWNENINMIVKKFILSAKWMHLLERMSLKCKIKNSKRLSIFVFDGLVLMPVWSVDNFSCSTHCSIDEKFVLLRLGLAVLDVLEEIIFFITWSFIPNLTYVQNDPA